MEGEVRERKDTEKTRSGEEELDRPVSWREATEVDGD